MSKEDFFAVLDLLSSAKPASVRDVKRAYEHELENSQQGFGALLKDERCPDKDIMGITGHVDRDVLNEYYAHTTADGRSKALEASGL